jgi:hypothetical protein
MSWKLSTLAIVVLAATGIGLATGSLIRPAKAAGPCCQTASAASDDAGPLAAAKRTDKDLIEKQKTCPVTDQPLGAMGKPVKMVVKGRTVFLCCAGCKKKLLADPDKYLKKLDEKKGDKQ